MHTSICHGCHWRNVQRWLLLWGGCDGRAAMRQMGAELRSGQNRGSEEGTGRAELVRILQEKCARTHRRGTSRQRLDAPHPRGSTRALCLLPTDHGAASAAVVQLNTPACAACACACQGFGVDTSRNWHALSASGRHAESSFVCMTLVGVTLDPRPQVKRLEVSAAETPSTCASTKRGEYLDSRITTHV